MLRRLWLWPRHHWTTALSLRCAASVLATEAGSQQNCSASPSLYGRREGYARRTTTNGLCDSPHIPGKTKWIAQRYHQGAQRRIIRESDHTLFPALPDRFAVVIPVCLRPGTSRLPRVEPKLKDRRMDVSDVVDAPGVEADRRWHRERRRLRCSYSQPHREAKMVILPSALCSGRCGKNSVANTLLRCCRAGGFASDLPVRDRFVTPRQVANFAVLSAIMLIPFPSASRATPGCDPDHIKLPCQRQARHLRRSAAFQGRSIP